MLSRRARESNEWFLEHFKRPLARQGSKSTSNIDLATAENWLIRPQMLPLLKKNCKKDLKAKHLSYAGGLGGTPELLAAVSAFFNHFFSPRIAVKPEHIVTGTGCSAILDTLMNDMCDTGEGLLVTAPMWGSFQVSAVLRNGVRLIPVYVSVHDMHSAEAVVNAYRTAVEEATCNVRGILFCNPHNPYGHICPVNVIDALLQYCEEADLHFVSDEIYALSTFGEIGESSAGCGEGCLVTQANKELRMSQAILNNAKICNAAAVMVAPILQDLSKLTTIVDLNISRLQKAAQIAIQFAEFHGLTYYRPVAGLYIWLRLSKECETGDDEEAVVRRCAELGVLVGSGADYAEPQPGWFRLTFSLPEKEFLEGLQRVEAAIGYKERFKWSPKKRSWGMAFRKPWRGLRLLMKGRML